MFSSTKLRHAAWLLAAAWLAGPAAVAYPGGAAKAPAAKRRAALATGSDAGRAEQARLANALYLRTFHPLRRIPVSPALPDAPRFVPSGEYLSTDELVQRESQRHAQGQQLLTVTAPVRLHIHEYR